MATDRLNRALNVLNRNRVDKSSQCGCEACGKRVKKAVKAGYACHCCGYSGQPYAVECACYDRTCAGGDQRGAGCFHGGLCCPVCDEGEGDISPWDLIKEVREILDGKDEEEDEE